MAHFLPLSGCLLALSVLSFGAVAQSTAPSPPPDASSANDTTELAKKLQNPIGDLYSIPFQNNTNFNAGPNKGAQDILNIQPVIPIHINENWNVITRLSPAGDKRVWTKPLSRQYLVPASSAGVGSLLSIHHPR